MLKKPQVFNSDGELGPPTAAFNDFRQVMEKKILTDRSADLSRLVEASIHGARNGR